MSEMLIPVMLILRVEGCGHFPRSGPVFQVRSLNEKRERLLLIVPMVGDRAVSSPGLA
jgi:hypothetical protein